MVLMRSSDVLLKVTVPGKRFGTIITRIIVNLQMNRFDVHLESPVPSKQFFTVFAGKILNLEMHLFGMLIQMSVIHIRLLTGFTNVISNVLDKASVIICASMQKLEIALCSHPLSRVAAYILVSLQFLHAQESVQLNRSA